MTHQTEESNLLREQKARGVIDFVDNTGLYVFGLDNVNHIFRIIGEKTKSMGYTVDPEQGLDTHAQSLIHDVLTGYLGNDLYETTPPFSLLPDKTIEDIKIRLGEKGIYRESVNPPVNPQIIEKELQTCMTKLWGDDNLPTNQPYIADFYNILQDSLKHIKEYPDNILHELAFSFTNRYVAICVNRYMGYSSPMDDKFLEKLYFPLENFLSFSTKTPKIDRNEMRIRYVGMILEGAKSKGETLPVYSLWMMSIVKDIKRLQEILQPMTMGKVSLLHIFYFASVICEFATDINKSVGTPPTEYF